jgi:hypothetical protein
MGLNSFGTALRSWIKGVIQPTLFTHMEECSRTTYTEQEKKLLAILEAVGIEQYVTHRRDNQWLGRPLKEREAMARAFLSKLIMKFRDTKQLRLNLLSNQNLRMICGFDSLNSVPSESSFSRAFKEFATASLGEFVHKAMVAKHLGSQLLGHVSHDSTVIKAREKPVKRPKKIKLPKKRGRRKKGEEAPPVEPKRLDIQKGQTPEEILAALPKECDRSGKKGSKGDTEYWRGYKFHCAVNDNGFPVVGAATSASLHDSQAMMYTMKEASNRVSYLYDLADAAYDAHQIKEQSKELGHVPVIDPNHRGGKDAIPMAPHEKERYKERTVVERFFSRLKDEFGGDHIMVRGHAKVSLHLMFGAIAIFADQLLRWSMIEAV